MVEPDLDCVGSYTVCCINCEVVSERYKKLSFCFPLKAFVISRQ